ncbi:MAG: hypothetical protein PVJ57_06175 [Phycisphaerae bacterium]|jgi:heme/copper-type cytochrome/quinol oxidase subunit 2
MDTFLRHIHADLSLEVVLVIAVVAALVTAVMAYRSRRAARSGAAPWGRRRVAIAGYWAVAFVALLTLRVLSHSIVAA